MKVLQWSAPHVKGNLGRWGREGHEREINKAIVPALGRKCKTHYFFVSSVHPTDIN